MHTSSVRIFPEHYEDCTVYQQHFLAAMAVHEINWERNIENRLKAIGESLGVKFKE